MTSDDCVLIGELKASVKGLQEARAEDSAKLDQLLEDVAFLRGRLEGYHTPLTCPHGAAVCELQAFKYKVLGIASALSVLIGVAVQLLKGVFTQKGTP
ncbi:MAG: hypothetical protein ACYC6A_09020 [Armatimonadota bacterium]